MSAQPKDTTAAVARRKQRSDGEGSIYQVHEPGCRRPVNPRTGESTCKCPWYGVLVVGYRDGKPMRKKRKAKTKSGAAARLRELRDQLANETLPVGKAPTVEQWMRYWLAKIAPRKIGALTLNNSYRQKTEQYIIPLLGSHKLDRLTPEHIEAAWDYLLDTGNPTKADARPLKPNTVHQTHAILRRALNVAVQRHKQTGLRVNPAGKQSMDAPPASLAEVQAMTLEECRLVIAAAEGRRNGARWSVALAMGLRQGEALGLTWDNVDLDEGVIKVRQALKRIRGRGLELGDLKSAAARRDLAIPAEMLPLMRAHRKEQNEERIQAGSAWEDGGFVFAQANGKPIDHSRDYKNWQQLLADAGVRKYRVHDARHSAATILLLQEVPTRVVMELMGHSQIGMTMRYQHAVDELKKNAAARVGSALFG